MKIRACMAIFFSAFIFYRGNDRIVKKPYRIAILGLRAPTVHCPWVMGHDAVAEPALPRPVPVPSTASACGYTPWLGLARVGRPDVPHARRQKRGKPRGRGGVKYTLHSDVHTGWGLMMPTCRPLACDGDAGRHSRLACPQDARMRRG